ncbi:CapA family protein [Streptomyces jeddahensis]|uniref:Capsule biosynthesis protein CapA n=1 Tax=Streptomyces jeddahensis TaxID=1716141 RepID=A0A177HJY6_9ACTN|nr:CapA family protein [Streptomyces jeddahensis]OAH11056.1 capsule biosynthesis protein CapA [Streptomyces jeddahensis]
MTQRTRRMRRGTALGATVLIGAAAGCTVADPAPMDPAPPRHRALQQSPAPSAANGGGRAQRGFTLVASGDVLPHSSVIRQANADAGGDGYDFRPMLAAAKPVVAKADLAICHMETVYGAQGHYSGYPMFKSPPEVAEALAETGYDTCSTASNHTLDDGLDGVRRTLDALDAAGVRHAGSARTAAEAQRPAWLRAGTAKVAHLAYTYGTNGIPRPTGKPWAVHLIDRRTIVADARAARTAGADVVVVSLHWGTEWQEEPDRRQLSLGRQLTASTTGGRPDIDLIIGTHAHIPQAYEKVNGTWIVYGMGDQVAGRMYNHGGAHDPRGNQSSIARFTFAPPGRTGGRWTVEKAEFIPQWFDPDTGRVVRLGTATDAGLGYVRDRIRRVVLSRGAAEDGLVMAE